MSYVGGPPADEPRVRDSLLRMIILTVPGQLLGVLVGGGLVASLYPDGAGVVPQLVIPVLAGLVSGLLVGLLVVPPTPAGTRSSLLAAGLVCVVSWIVLNAIGRLSLSGGQAGSPWYGVLLGLLVVTAPHLVVCLVTWRLRSRQ